MPSTSMAASASTSLLPLLFCVRFLCCKIIIAFLITNRTCFQIYAAPLAFHAPSAGVEGHLDLAGPDFVHEDVYAHFLTS